MHCSSLIVILLLFTAGPLTAQSVTATYRTAADPAAWVIDNFEALRGQNADTALFYVNAALQDPTIAPERRAKLHQLSGIAHYLRGDYEAELAAHQRGLRLAEELGDEGLQGQILLELGMGANRQGELSTSIAYNRRAIALCASAGNADCQAAASRNLGRTYLKTDLRDSAVYFLTTSLDLRREMRDTLGMSYGLNDLSQLAAEDGRFNEAVNYLQESSSYRRAAGDSSGLAININNLGELYLMNDDLPAARRELEKSLAISTRVRYTALQQHTLGLLADIYEQQNDYAAAYANLQTSAALRDSLYGVEKARSISDLQVAYDTESKERTIEAQAAELRAQRLLGLVILLGLALLGAVIYYRVYQRRRYEQRIAELTLREKLNAERERISRDLHDSVGANLTRIVTDLDLLSLKGEHLSDAVAHQVADTRHFTRGTIGLLRDTIWALHKDEYHAGELASKMRDYLRSYLGDRLEWRVDTDITQDRGLSSEQVLNLLRILQEAAQNTLKHAEAERFVVTVTSTPDSVTVTFEDDGQGLNASANDEATGGHYGLKSMRRRATIIGGNLTTDTPAGGGVRHRVVLT